MHLNKRVSRLCFVLFLFATNLVAAQSGGDMITVASCQDDYARQQWKNWSAEDLTVRMTKPNTVLDIPKFATTAGQQLDVWGYTGKQPLNRSNQEYHYKDGMLTSIMSGLCVGVPTSSNKVELCNCSDGSSVVWQYAAEAQQWVLADRQLCMTTGNDLKNIKMYLVDYATPKPHSSGYGNTRYQVVRQPSPHVVDWPDFTLHMPGQNATLPLWQTETLQSINLTEMVGKRAQPIYQQSYDAYITPGNVWIRPLEWIWNQHYTPPTLRLGHGPRTLSSGRSPL
eukprot:TRINITY_DN10437_c0_g1_i2.p2 TRINITY_DN10437_c0_g1~~TRINITY_DN10437_c0_g1_i2.p2  ORF type:complete len:282 (+),score=47.78 TRINITY_DN10437_c0_g1_i2:1324-2169(+)